MSIHLVAANSVPRRAYINALNDAYADYFVPTFISTSFFKTLVEHEDIDLGRSVAALKGQSVVGTCMLGIRDKAGWIGGMGVLPAYRRQGLARRMMHYLIEQAEQAGLTELQLEVIAQNVAATELYRSLGFEIHRTLYIMVNGGIRTPHHVPAQYTVRSMRGGFQAEDYAHLPDSPLPWQRHITPRFSRMAYIDLQRDGASVGVCAYEKQGGAVAIMFAAAENESAGQAVITALQNRYPERRITMLNVGDDDPFLTVLEATEFSAAVEQYEMFLKLK